MNEQRGGRGGMGHFTRGTEIAWHQAHMFFASIRRAVLVWLFVAIAVAGLFGATRLSAVDRSNLIEYAWAKVLVGWDLGQGKVRINENGVIGSKPAAQVVALLEEPTADARGVVRRIAIGGSVLGAVIAVLYVFGISWFGKRKMTDEHLRGARIVSSEALTKEIEARDGASPYVLAGVPMRKGAETLHAMFGGAQGTGKSQLFFELLDQVRARGRRAIVYDPSGEFTATYYRPGKDVILNPMDARSPNWNIWNEIESEYHFDNLAKGLIPDSAKDADPFWGAAGRMVFKDVAKVLARDGMTTNRALHEAISLNGLTALNALLAGTAGATYTDPATERTGMSLKMTVMNQLECFRFLRDDGERFSIRKWVREESDSWLFISTSEAQASAVLPVLSLWVNTAIQTVLELEPIHRERLWFMIDEFPRLQKLESIELALTNVRKYGLCIVLGVQDFAQLRAKYGPDIAQTIISQCQTKVLLRIADGRAAKVLSELMGSAEMDEKEETFSMGARAEKDGTSIYARRAQREVVMSSEILTLGDMEGFLMTPGPYPVGRIKYVYKPRPAVVERFIARDDPMVRPLGPQDSEPSVVPTAAPVAAVVAGDPGGIEAMPKAASQRKQASTKKVANVADVAEVEVIADEVVIDKDSGLVLDEAQLRDARRSKLAAEIRKRGAIADMLF
jgi:type IV conjugative transfer system coupling protein TraD